MRRFPTLTLSLREREQPRSAEWKADGYGLFSSERMVQPLPKGEGRGEGKEITAPRSADVVASACGQCQQGNIPIIGIHDFKRPAFPEGP